MTVGDWKPVAGLTVQERGDNEMAVYPALYECPRCAAAVQRGSLDKHDEWHFRELLAGLT